MCRRPLSACEESCLCSSKQGRIQSRLGQITIAVPLGNQEENGDTRQDDQGPVYAQPTEPVRAGVCTDRPQPGIRSAPRRRAIVILLLMGYPFFYTVSLSLQRVNVTMTRFTFCRRRKPDRGPHCRRQIPECAVDNALLYGGQPHAGTGPGDDHGRWC